ncbi:hypothetical protein HDV00_009232 [Rhizophlyctis rosea]|nr:hypothetical protein HDV00_009232 [Rhizophlyctis rosea]
MSSGQTLLARIGAHHPVKILSEREVLTKHAGGHMVQYFTWDDDISDTATITGLREGSEQNKDHSNSDEQQAVRSHAWRRAKACDEMEHVLRSTTYTSKSLVFKICTPLILLLAPLSYAFSSITLSDRIAPARPAPLPQNIMPVPTSTATHPPHTPAQLVAFGDSLTSTSNGRWTDGAVWIERVASALRAKLDNNAWGGAVSGPVPGPDGTTIKGWVPNVLDQVDRWTRSITDRRKDNYRSDETVYVIWVGGNDYFQLAKHTPYPITMPVVRNLMSAVLTTPSRVVTNIQSAMIRLITGPTNARHFLLFNLPPLDHVPLVTTHMPAAIRPVIKGWVKYHNYRVSQIPEWVRTTYGPGSPTHIEGVTVTIVDVYSVMEDVVAHPHKFGFDGKSMEGLEEEPGYGRKGSERRLFYDLVHPSAWAHEKLAEVVVGKLRGEGVEIDEGKVHSGVKADGLRAQGRVGVDL